MARKFTILPRRWRGIRNSESALLLEPDEWADSKNFDARFGWSNDGSIEQITAGPVSKEVILLRHYYDTAGTLHRVWVNEDGTIFEDTTDVGLTVPGITSLTAIDRTIPYFAAGTGAAVITRASQNPVWKDPGDATWKELTGPPATFKGVTFDVGGPRLFGFPGSLGPDAWAWSAVGDFNDWTTAGGGGEEPIGNNREDIVAIEGGLEANIGIYKRNSIWLRSGADPESWSIVNVSNDIGLTAPNSLLRIGKAHFIAHDSGAYFVNAIGSVSFPSLTFRIQDTWDRMIDNFGEYLRYAHAAYHPRQNVVHLWIPNQASRIMNRLIKIFVADGSVTIHDSKDTGSSDFFPASGGGQMEYGKDSKIFKIAGRTDDGTAITTEITSGIFSGSPPSMDTEKRWGLRGVLHFFFEAETGGETVTVTPRIYRGNSRITGTAQSFALTADQVSKVKVRMSDDSGWGVDFIIAGTFTTGRVRWLGYAGEYTDVTDE